MIIRREDVWVLILENKDAGRRIMGIYRSYESVERELASFAKENWEWLGCDYSFESFEDEQEAVDHFFDLGWMDFAYEAEFIAMED